MRRLVIVLIALGVIGVGFVGLGLANQGHFQFSAIVESERLLKAFFEEPGESLSEVEKPDYSLGRIEIMAKTKKAEYITVLFVTNPEWVTLTALNFFINPTVAIKSVEEKT